jgi:hypothetical protein
MRIIPYKWDMAASFYPPWLFAPPALKDTASAAVTGQESYTSSTECLRGEAPG